MDAASLFQRATLSLSTTGRDDVVYFDEQLPLTFQLRLPGDVHWSDEQAYALFSSPAVSLALELGYTEAAGSQPTKRSTQTGLGVSSLALEPLTPAPSPGISEDQEAYATVSPVSTTQVIFDAQKDKLHIARDNGNLVCCFDMSGPVTSPSMPVSSPMLVVTATVALREIADSQLAAALRPSEPAQQLTPRSDAAAVRAAKRSDEEYRIDAVGEMNLLAGLERDPAFSEEAPFLPSSRLPPSMLRANFGGVESHSHARSASLAMSHSRFRSQERIDPEAIPALRRSVRAVYKARSALYIRLRVIDLGPLICVELENNADNGCLVEVEKVEIDALPISEQSFPFTMQPVEQFNLLFEPTMTQTTDEAIRTHAPTPIAATMLPSRSFSRAPLPMGNEVAPRVSLRDPSSDRRITAIVTMRVLSKTSGYEVDGETRNINTATFTSSCSTTLNLAEIVAKADRQSTEGRISRTPAGVNDPRLSLKGPTRKASQPVTAEAIAGSKRHTMANLATLGAAAARSASPQPMASPTARMSLMDSPRRPTSALPLPSFGRRFFSTPTPASPQSAPTEEQAGETIGSPPPPTPAYPPYAGPAAPSGGYFDRAPVIGSAKTLENGLLVSISLQPLRQRKLEALLSRAQPVINVLDMFLVEIFVANRSTTIRRFTIGVPARKARKGPRTRTKTVRDVMMERSERLERYAAVEASKAGLMPLENNVRIGPLLPNTVQTVRMRFLALQPGVHVIDELQLIEVGTGTIETRLKDVLTIAVDEPQRQPT